MAVGRPREEGEAPREYALPEGEAAGEVHLGCARPEAEAVEAVPPAVSSRRRRRRRRCPRQFPTRRRRRRRGWCAR